MAIGKKEAKLLTALIDQLVPQDFGQSYGAETDAAREKLRSLATDKVVNKPTRLGPAYKP